METRVLSVKQKCNRDWHQRNKEKVREYTKRWLLANPEKARAMRRRKYLKDRDRLRAEYKQNRPSMVLKKHGVDVLTAEGGALLQSFVDGCRYCGSSEKLEVDHKVPTSRGGGKEVGNLQWLCGRCNRAKSDQTEEEFFAHIALVLDRKTRRS